MIESTKTTWWAFWAIQSTWWTLKTRLGFATNETSHTQPKHPVRKGKAAGNKSITTWRDRRQSRAAGPLAQLQDNPCQEGWPGPWGQGKNHFSGLEMPIFPLAENIGGSLIIMVWHSFTVFLSEKCGIFKISLYIFWLTYMWWGYIHRHIYIYLNVHVCTNICLYM